MYILFICLLSMFSTSTVFAEKTPVEIKIEKISAALASEKTPEYQYYVQYFEKIFETMEANYYRSVPRTTFEKFLARFDK